MMSGKFMRIKRIMIPMILIVILMALDPNLTPRSNGETDITTKAFVSQYRVEDRSSSEIASIKGPGYVATFKGVDVRLMNIYDVLRSKKFYIPNALVTDVTKIPIKVEALLELSTFIL